MRKGLLIDFTRCIGCGACMRGCREANGLPQPGPDAARPDRLDGDNYTVVLRHESEEKGAVFYRHLCMHCDDATCVSACAVNALRKRPDGAVLYDADRCFGCRYCMVACPFHIPKYTWDTNVPVVSKCILCWHRLDKGQEPACAATCPTGATRFGAREVLLKVARERTAALPDRYVNHIFGEREAGGTNVLMISPVPFEQLGFQTQVPARPLPELTWMVQEKIPYVIVTGGFFLWGLQWIIKRRMELAQEGIEPGGSGGARG